MVFSASDVASLLQGGGQPAVPGVKQVTNQPQLQGSAAIPLQGSTLNLQGTSPNLQPTVNPATLPAATVIHVPSAPAVPPPAAVTPNPAPAVAQPAAPVLPDKTNDINVNKAALEGADTQYGTGLTAIQSALDKLFGRYGSEATNNESNYTEQSNVNKNNRETGTQAALEAAAQGRKGLFSVLSSLGALNGSGIDLANLAVQHGANEDITGANETFGQNQTALDTGIANFRTEDQKRRDAAQSATEASRVELKNQLATNKQKIYSNIANDYSAEGDAGQAKTYSDLVASLFPEIAQTSVPAPAVTYTPPAYTPSTLSKYVGGNTNTQVSVAAPDVTGVPSLIAGTPRKRIA